MIIKIFMPYLIFKAISGFDPIGIYLNVAAATIEKRGIYLMLINAGVIENNNKNKGLKARRLIKIIIITIATNR